MSSFEYELDQDLAGLRAQGLYRQLRRIDSAQSPHLLSEGKPLLNFSSNDYLGLANEPALKQAAERAIERYGVGAGAARLICGSLAPHHELEEVIAEFKGTEAALSFASGYAAALGTLGALLGKNDVVIVDKLVHASMVDAARLCGATLRVFPHNDLNRLEKLLKSPARSLQSIVHSPQPEIEVTSVRARRPRVLVVTESLFSMDGDRAPLAEIVALKNQYGAWLMVDEAHATGLYGAKRSGLSEQLGLSSQIEIQMSTLGKALGSAGGCVCGSRKLVDCLVNRARSFIFSTAPVPAAAAAATAAIRLVQSAQGQQRCQRLWGMVGRLRRALHWPESGPLSPILPLVVGDEARALEQSHELRRLGIYIPAIRYPTVARGRARLRLTLSAAHTEEEVQQLLTALDKLSVTRGCTLDSPH